MELYEGLMAGGKFKLVQHADLSFVPSLQARWNKEGLRPLNS